MIHARANHPRIYPWNSARVPEQIDRAQDIGGDLTLSKTKLYEIGRVGKLGEKKETSRFSYSLRQYEYGSMAFWRALANKEDPGTGDPVSVDLDDIKSEKFDISADLTDDSGTFVGSVWFPRLRLNGFTLNIGDPDAIIERNWDLVGEKYDVMPGEYFAYAEKVSAGATLDIDFGGTGEAPTPVEYDTGLYIHRVLRVVALTGEVEECTTWTYSPTTLAITDIATGDIIKVYYESATPYETLWTDNDTPGEDALYADQVSIFLKIGSETGDGEQIFRLQSIGIDVALERKDYKEIGNKNVVQTGVSAKTVTVTLGRILEDFTLEEVLSGKNSPKYINTDELSEDVTLIIKIYTDNTKTNFKMGYKITDLAPTALSIGQAIEDYGTANNSLESDNLLVSTDEDEIDA